MKILMIQRAEQFSPNAVENDRAILEAVALRLSSRGHLVTQVDETLLASSLAADKPDFIFSMARLPESLRLLQASGIKVVNAPQGVSQCSRRQPRRQMMWSMSPTFRLWPRQRQPCAPVASATIWSVPMSRATW